MNRVDGPKYHVIIHAEWGVTFFFFLSNVVLFFPLLFVEKKKSFQLRPSSCASRTMKDKILYVQVRYTGIILLLL